MLWSWTCFGAFRTGTASNTLPWIIFPICQQVTVPRVSAMTEHRPSSVRCHRAALLAGSSCVLACLQLTVVHQHAGTSPWHTPWFLSGFCYLATSGEEIAPAWRPVSAVTSETFVLPHGQIHTGGMPGEKCQHNRPPPVRVSRRPGRAGSWPGSRSLKHLCTVSEKNAAISGNLSSCLMSLDSS